MKGFNTVDELEAFILKHGENIVDLMGGEIDRIEIKLRVSASLFIMLFGHASLNYMNFLEFSSFFLFLDCPIKFVEKIPRSAPL